MHIRADNLNNVKSLNTTTHKHGNMHTHNMLEIFYRHQTPLLGCTSPLPFRVKLACTRSQFSDSHRSVLCMRQR